MMVLLQSDEQLAFLYRSFQYLWQLQIGYTKKRAFVPSCGPASLPLLAKPNSPSSFHLNSSSPSSGSRGRLGNGGLPQAAAPAASASGRHQWRVGVSSFSFLPAFLTGKKEKDDKKAERLKEELLAVIAPLDRCAEITSKDQERVERIIQQLEEVNLEKEPFKSEFLNGKWELLYTTSASILQPQRPKFLRPYGKIYQAIDAETLRAQNMETWPYFNQIPIKSPGSGKGELEITYLDEELSDRG